MALGVRTGFCLSLALVACSSTSSGVGSGPLSAGGTLDFVMSSIVIDQDDGSPAAGVNVDGLFSNGGTDGCGFADRLSDLDRAENLLGCLGSSCRGGVDNLLPRLINGMDDALQDSIRSRLASAVSRGILIYLVRLTGVDDLVNDPAVAATLYYGFANQIDCTSLLTGNGHFLVDNASLAVSGDLTMPVWRANGSIVNGRFSARYGSTATMATEAPTGFPVNQLTLRATLGASGASAAAGNLGGWVSGNDLRDLTTSLFPMLRPTLFGLIPEYDDLPSLASGACGGPWAFPVGGMGIGFRFALVQAHIDGTSSSAVPGSCGS